MHLKEICDLKRGIENACFDKELYLKNLRSFVLKYQSQVSTLRHLIDNQKLLESRFFIQQLIQHSDILGYRLLHDISKETLNNLHLYRMSELLSGLSVFEDKLEDAISATEDYLSKSRATFLC